MHVVYGPEENVGAINYLRRLNPATPMDQLQVDEFICSLGGNPDGLSGPAIVVFTERQAWSETDMLT